MIIKSALPTYLGYILTSSAQGKFNSMGSGCDAVGRVVVSDARGPRYKSKFTYSKRRKQIKEAWNGSFLKVSFLLNQFEGSSVKMIRTSFVVVNVLSSTKWIRSKFKKKDDVTN